MRLLAIETATEACSAALHVDGEVRERFAVEPRRHSELILPMMEQLLADAGLTLSRLDALAFGRGPGAFTGVRIAAGVVQGAAFAADLPVVPVSTLAALAQHARRRHGVERALPAYDARMGELYWGVYGCDDGGLMRPLFDDAVVAPQAARLPDGAGWFGAGSGWATYGDALAERLGDALGDRDPALLCSAVDVAALAVAGFQAGEAVPADRALPVYLRERVAAKPARPT